MAIAFGGEFGCEKDAQSSASDPQDRIDLPAPDAKGEMPLEEAIARRRSVREFSGREVTLAQISQLVWAAQGMTDPERGYRAAPSAGATYPLEIYIVKKDGLFHYLPQSHSLAKKGGRDLREALAQAALGQSSVAQAPVDIVIAAAYGRTRARYKERAQRYVQMEAGHAAQNILLQAVALGLGAVPVGAFEDDALFGLLDLPSDQAPLYIIPVGYAK